MTNRVGQHIDAYRLLCLLGTGSSGEVYLGEHLDDQTLAAVKLLNMDQDNLKAFVKEASTIFRLKHPHILPLLAFGMNADDITYLVMDYAPNRTLRQCHPQGTRLPLDTVASYVLSLTTALQYAHDRSAIHGNIKPEHVFISQDWKVLLGDFAVVVCAPLDQGSLSPQNLAGMFPYMAPEQTHGQAQAASDQYALGVMVYEWLYGELPFRGPLWETSNHYQSSPPLLLREKLADLPSLVQESLLKVLAQDPQDRFARIEDFAAAFRHLASVGVSAVVLSSASQLSTIAIPQPEQIPGVPTIPVQQNDLFFTLSPLAPNDPPSPKILTNHHQTVFTPHPTPSLLTTTSSPILDSAESTTFLPSLLSNSSTMPQSALVSPRHPATRHNLTRSKDVFLVTVLLLLGVGCIFFFLAVGINLVKFPSKAITPTLTPQYLIATAAARAYAIDTTKNGAMLGFDSAHTHWNPYEKVLNRTNISHLKQRWSYTTDNEIASSPVVANGIIYVTSYDGKLYAFDTSCRITCQPLWSYTTGNAIISSPAVANGLVYVGSYDHKLYAFDASCRSACQPLWSYATGDAIYSSPTVANGLVYIGSDDDKLYAFDATCRSACQPLWSYTTNNVIHSSPTVANGLIYVGSADYKLYAFDATCRSACLPLWSYATNGPIGSSPAVTNGLIYVGSEDNKLYAFDASCRSACQPLWSYATGNAIFSSPAVANGLVYIGSEDNKLYAFDASCRSACQPLWSYDTGNLIYSSPTVANGLVYIGSWDNGLYAFDATCHRACQPLWSYPTDGHIVSSPTVANGLVYIGSYDHKLYAFGIKLK